METNGDHLSNKDFGDLGDHLLGYFILIRVGCKNFLKILWRPTETNEDIGDQWRLLIGIFIYKFLFLLK